MIKFEQDTMIRKVLLEKYQTLREKDEVNPHILQSILFTYQIMNINNACLLYQRSSETFKQLAH